MRIVASAGTIIVAVSFACVSPALAGTKTTGTWAAPDLQKTAYTKIVVLARFSEDTAKRVLEDTLVKMLKDKGVDAVPAWQVLKPEDLASPEAIDARAQALGADAGIVFTVEGQSTEVQSGPTVSASVGVPVRVGPFSMFVGTSVPLGGGSTAVRKVAVKARFVTRGGENPRWIGNYSTDVANGTEQAAEEVATQTMKQMKKIILFK
jgi:hypothetical protein